MNYVIPESRAFLCQYRNGDNFATNPTTDFVPYMKGNVIEKLKLNATYSVYTIVNEEEETSIRAYTTGGGIFMKLPTSSWKTEGIVVGNTVRVEANGKSVNATVLSLIGTLMKISDSSFFATLGTVDGDFRDDYVVKVTTRPTSLIFKFGLIRNDIVANSYGSMFDLGQLQAYSKNGVDGTPSFLNYLSSNSSNLGSVSAAYAGVSGTGNYIFEFDISHIFRIPHFLSEWADEYLGGGVPTRYAGLNSIRYTSELNFGVNIANPNDGKIFLDDFELGSVGFNGQSFNGGVVNYELVSTTLTVGGVATTTPQAGETNSFTCQIHKIDGDFSAGVRGILYHSRLADEATYSDNSNTFDTNFMIDQLTQSDGDSDVSSDIIKDLAIDINGSDASLLDITFDIIYDAAEQARLVDEDIIFLGLSVGNISLDAELSDRMTVPLFAEKIFKDPDVYGLIDTFEDAYNNLGSTDTSSNIDTWNNRAIENEFSFNLNKDGGEDYVYIDSIKFDLVAYNVSDDKFFSLDTFTFPIGALPLVNIGGYMYQLCNIDTTRVLSVPEDCSLREVQLNFTNPGIPLAGDPAVISGKIGFIVPWREWILNPYVDYVFYNGALPPTFNRNYRTSNYSDLLGYDIYIFKTVKVRSAETTDLGTFETVTEYILQSDESFAYDFDEDGAGDSWTHVSTTIYNEAGDELEELDLSGYNTIEIIMAQASAGSIPMNEVIGEITMEDTLTSGRHWRLHSTIDMFEPDNPLVPLEGESYVKVTQMIAENQIKLECRCDGTKLTDSNKNIYGHFYE